MKGGGEAHFSAGREDFRHKKTASESGYFVEEVQLALSFLNFHLFKISGTSSPDRVNIPK